MTKNTLDLKTIPSHSRVASIDVKLSSEDITDSKVFFDAISQYNPYGYSPFSTKNGSTIFKVLEGKEDYESLRTSGLLDDSYILNKPGVILYNDKGIPICNLTL